MDRRTLMLRSAVALLLAGRSRSVFAAADPDGRALNALFDQFMKENLDLSPSTATSLGLDAGRRAAQKGELDDLSEAGFDRQKALTASQLARLEAFDRASLGREDTVSYNVILYGLRTGAAANKAFTYGEPAAGGPYVLNHFTSSFVSVPSFLETEHQIINRHDADAYLTRLTAFARQLDQEVESARHDAAQGVVPPDFVLERTLDELQLLRRLEPLQSPLTESVVRRTREQHIPGDYAQSASTRVRDEIYPALDRQIALLHELRRNATHDAGVWKLPQGEAYYAASLLAQVTTDRKPADIHAQGLEIIKEHSALLDQLLRKQGLTHGTVGERASALQKDPKALYPNSDAGKEALIADLNRRVKSIWSKLPTYFGVVPKATVEIRRMPKAKEAGGPPGEYSAPPLDGSRPGIYWINLRDTAETPKSFVPTLTYHESIPGHHLQGSIQLEAALPLIRKVASFDAYAEGWAVYAEQLAGEMGEYDTDPIGHIGQLLAAMMRAVRMVVDSGIHSMRWSRERGIQFYLDTLGGAPRTAVSEIERYCVIPAQACCYMLGKVEFLAARERARTSQGANFDIRKFHDSVLLPGALPLDMLRDI